MDPPDECTCRKVEPVKPSDLFEVAKIGQRVFRANLLGPPTHGGMAILFNPRGEALFSFAKYRRAWNFPGGFCNPDEPPEIGIRRELIEEVNYPADGPELTIVHSISRRVHTEFLAVVQLSQDQADRLHPVSWEIREARWCAPENTPPVNVHVRKLLAGNGGVISRVAQRWVPGPRAQAILDGEMKQRVDPT